MDFKQIRNFKFDKDKKSSLQIKAVKGLAVFLVLMFLLTVISRAADSLTIAKVNVISSSSMAIQHKIEADGMIASNKEIAISTAPGVKIASVEVQEGHLVKKDDLMIQLDMDDLQKKLLEAQKELKLLEAAASDKAANEAIAAQEEQKTRSRAYEDYNQTMRDAADSVRAAKKAMNDALSAYNEAKNSSGETNDDTTVREQLEKAKTEKSELLDNARKELDSVESYIEEQKNQLIDKNVSEFIESEVNKMIDEETDIRYNKQSESSDETSETMSREKIRQKVEEELKEKYTSEIQEEKKIDIQSITKAAEDEIDKQYEKTLKDAQQKVADAETALTDAETALSTYDDEQAAAAANNKDARLAELYSAYEEKKAAYEESVKAYNETQKSADRGLQDLESTPTIDTVTPLTAEDEKNLKELEVKKYQDLFDAEGKITSPSDGLVTKVVVSTGETTPEDTAIRISDQSAGYRFTAAINKEDAKYLKAGDKISLVIGNDVTIDNLPITKLEASSENKDSFNVIADIPSKVTKISNFASMSVVRESERYYTCVPLNVLHSDGDSYYVYAVTTKESVLGTENTVAKVEVQILDKNAEYAAIDGYFDWDQQFVLTSNKTLNDGDRVRIQGTSQEGGE